MNPAELHSDTFPRIQKIMSHQLKKKPEQIIPTAQLQKDLGADSLDALEIVMSLEEEFSISIPEEQARKAVTVQDVIDVVLSQVAEKK